jgi:hypothetical protein
MCDPLRHICHGHSDTAEDSNVGSSTSMAAIFMFGGGGPEVRNSVESASSYMEAIDVQNGEYEVVYDDLGLVYMPQVEGHQVRLVPTDTRNRDDLIRRLAVYSEMLGLALDPDSQDFPIEVARSIADSEWSRRWPKRPRWLSRRMHGSGPPDF